MYRKPFIIALVAIFVLTISSICFADQKVDTSSKEAYSNSLTAIYNNLSADKQLEFTAFFYSFMENGQKWLPKMSTLEKGSKSLEFIYPLVKSLEGKDKLNINGLTAEEIITQGKSLLCSNLEKKIEKATDETRKKELQEQLELVKKPNMTSADFEAYQKYRAAL